MKYPHSDTRIAGLLVPLAALRSEHSTGCGEFADLPALAGWCASAGLKIIQLLPVNDSGGDSSPYSAISACALHPMYLRIDALPELTLIDDTVKRDVQLALNTLRSTQAGRPRFSYDEVNTGKLNILRTIHAALPAGTPSLAGEMDHFLEENPWVKAYAVFRTLKDRQEQRAWMHWSKHQEADQALVETLWNTPELQHATRFYQWLQLRLAGQFSQAAAEVSKLGVALKGDIPILMNEDSADVWYRPEVFRRELQAGAPPDMFSRLGQNWGFPVYNWQNLEEENYQWWRQRLRQAARYYHAYRIDHVLGFFRIWAIPRGNSTGLPGFFWPQDGISRDELLEAGFDQERLRWLKEPHIRGDQLREALGPDVQVESLEGAVLRRIGGEDLFLFAPEICGENDLSEIALPQGSPETLRDWLLDQYRDRVFLDLPDGRLATTWTFRECWRFQTLSQGEKERLEEIAARHQSSSNELWAGHGRTLLQFMMETTEMLTCAEDLGVIPEAVPRVMKELGALGLMIPRWSHYWDRPGEPAIPLGEYPAMSVCAPSVHDTSTMRGWWEGEAGREILWELAGQDGPCPQVFDSETARRVYGALMRCGSRIVVFQLQDLLVLDPDLPRTEPAQERVNVPGTANSFNWTWRMPIPLETLNGTTPLTAAIQELVKLRN